MSLVVCGLLGVVCSVMIGGCCSTLAVCKVFFDVWCRLLMLRRVPFVVGSGLRVGRCSLVDVRRFGVRVFVVCGVFFVVTCLLCCLMGVVCIVFVVMRCWLFSVLLSDVVLCVVRCVCLCGVCCVWCVLCSLVWLLLYVVY